ncbi:MAG: hypothetical protein ACRYG2_17625 [Janthinobacterium lividum]
MRTPTSHAPLELSAPDRSDVVLTRRAVDGTVTGRLRWAARSTSHAVTCDYLVGRGLRVCSCGASRVAAA